MKGLASVIFRLMESEDKHPIVGGFEKPAVSGFPLPERNPKSGVVGYVLGSQDIHLVVRIRYYVK